MGEKPRTIVLLSGGMNSAAMIYDFVTFQKAEILDCMIFDSYQPSEDVICARALCEKLELPFSLWDLEPAPIVSTRWLTPDDLGKEWVDDLHNACFMQMLVAAVRHAKLTNAESIAVGLCHDDADVGFEIGLLTDFVDAVGLTLNIGKRSMQLNLPLWEMSKPDIFKLAKDLNRLVEVLGDTYSCLKHDADIRHQWGHGCGSCDGCVRRWRAWDEYLQMIGQGPKA